MEKTEKIKLTNSNQFEKLVEELQKNPSLARGFRRGIVGSNFKQQWEELTQVLNALGPPRRLEMGGRSHSRSRSRSASRGRNRSHSRSASRSRSRSVSATRETTRKARETYVRTRENGRGENGDSGYRYSDDERNGGAVAVAAVVDSPSPKRRYEDDSPSPKRSTHSKRSRTDSRRHGGAVAGSSISRSRSNSHRD